MKANINKKLGLTTALLLGTLCCMQATLFAGPKKKLTISNKNKKNENLDEVFKSFEQKIKEDSERKIKEEQKELQKKQEKEQTNQQKKKALFNKYFYLEEFCASQNEDALQKNILNTYKAWLITIKNILIDQYETFFPLAIAYAKDMNEAEIHKNIITSAWGEHIKFIDKNKYIVLYIPQPDNLKLLILSLRYCPSLNNGSLHLVSQDYEFLNKIIRESEDNEKAGWLAKAILATHEWNKKETLSASSAKKFVHECLKQKNRMEKYGLFSGELKKMFVYQTTIQKIIIDDCMSFQKDNIDTSKETLEKLLIVQNEAFQKKKEFLDLLDNEIIKIGIPDSSIKTEQQIEHSQNEEEKEIIFAQDEHKNSTKTVEKPIYFKVNPNKKTPFTMSSALPRVTDWFENPEEFYIKHVEIYNKEKSERDYNLMVKFHTFSYAVDFFIEALAIKCNWIAKGARKGDISYNLPGQIIFSVKDDEGKTKTITMTGVFSYGITKDGVLFHRCFSERNYKDIQEQIQELREYAEYPASNFDITTSEKQIKKQLKLKSIIFEDYEENIKENSFYIEIKDEKNDMIIRLFKSK